MELESPQENEAALEDRKKFAELKVGDHVTTIAEITQIRYDEKNDPPDWILYYLYDGTSTIRVFRNEVEQFEVGDVAKIDLHVREGKPYNNTPQLAYRVNLLQKIDKKDSNYAKQLQNLRYREVLRKSDLQRLTDGARVKLFTKILSLHPTNGVKEKFQKILVVDVTNKPISLWFPKECFPLFECIEEDEYFVLKAIVKTVEQNQSARFLSFETFSQGKEAYNDPVARQFFEERIRHHSGELSTYLKLWQTYAPEFNLDINVLSIILQAFRRDMYPEDA